MPEKADTPSAYVPQIGSPDPKKAKSGTYIIEPNHTQIEFTVMHMGLSEFSGFFSGVSGTLKLDPAYIDTTEVSITIPINTVRTIVDKLNNELKDPDWFDAAHYPAASFKSTSGVNLLNKKDAVGFESTTTISSNTFSVNHYVPIVGNAVTLLIAAAFDRQTEVDPVFRTGG